MTNEAQAPQKSRKSEFPSSNVRSGIYTIIEIPIDIKENKNGMIICSLALIPM